MEVMLAKSSKETRQAQGAVQAGPHGFAGKDAGIRFAVEKAGDHTNGLPHHARLSSLYVRAMMTAAITKVSASDTGMEYSTPYNP